MKTTDLEPADSSLESLCALIGVGVCALIGAPVVARTLRASESAVGTDGISAAPVPTATRAPDGLAHETPASAPMDWTAFLWIGGTAAVLVLAVFAWKRLSAHVCDRKKAQSALETDFADAQNALSEVAAAYAEFLADPNDRYFVRPSLDDIDDRHTAAFIDAFAAANELRPDTCPDSKERVLHFADAAHAARTAWEAADQNARTVGMGEQGKKRTQKVGRVRTALALIRNRGTGAEGRAADCVEDGGPALRPRDLGDRIHERLATGSTSAPLGVAHPLRTSLHGSEPSTAAQPGTIASTATRPRGRSDMTNNIEPRHIHCIEISEAATSTVSAASNHCNGGIA